ncbi:MAG: hypothetical protein Q8P18_11300 [Pseudomonadota bacterium]|nr:hypothetical protein [Pseudomonadota bacterium]
MRTFHLTYTTRGRQPLFPGEALRRAAVRSLVRVGGGWIVLFCLVDEHAHVVVLCEPAALRRIARSLHMTLSAHASVPVLPAHVEPVDNRGHMTTLVRYALTQVDHHALHAHPATWSGACFLDLVGARMLPGWRMNIHEALPRFGIADAMKAVGLPGSLPEPVGDAALKEVGVHALVAAAADAAGADPSLPGRTTEVVAARRTAISLARSAGIGPAALAEGLALSTRGCALLGEASASEDLVRAARVRIGIVLTLAERGVAMSQERAVVRGRR